MLAVSLRIEATETNARRNQDLYFTQCVASTYTFLPIYYTQQRADNLRQQTTLVHNKDDKSFALYLEENRIAHGNYQRETYFKTMMVLARLLLVQV